MDRDWLVDLANIENYKVALVASFPAMFYVCHPVLSYKSELKLIINYRLFLYFFFSHSDHPHRDGPTNHSSHRQPKGQQAQGGSVDKIRE